MIINGDVYENPYNLEQFAEMMRKLDLLCDTNQSSIYLKILRSELVRSDDTKTLTKSVCKELVDAMQELTQTTPCGEAFYNSIFLEFYKTFRNEPISHILAYIDKLALMSKT